MMLFSDVILRHTIFIISDIIEDKLNYLINSISDNLYITAAMYLRLFL